MRKFVTLDLWAEKNNLTIPEAFEQLLLGKDYAFVHLGSQDNMHITTPGYYRLSKSVLAELKNLSSGEELQNHAFHVFHPLITQVWKDGNNYFMSFDLITDYYLNSKNYIRELSIPLAQEPSYDSGQQLENNLDDKVLPAAVGDGLSKSDENNHVFPYIGCSVKFSHEIVGESPGKRCIKLNDSAISFLQESSALLPRFCRIIPHALNIGIEQVKEMYSYVSVAFFLRHFNDKNRKYNPNQKFVVTKQSIKSNKIYVLSNISFIANGSLNVPNYFNPFCDEFQYNERAVALFAVLAAKNENKYPDLIHSDLVLKVLNEELNLDCSKDDDVFKRINYMSQLPGAPRTHKMKKNKNKK